MTDVPGDHEPGVYYQDQDLIKVVIKLDARWRPGQGFDMKESACKN